tara:strand:+ start:16777 stop:18630 length:1854 start_codon:yes stop_codon:yes gene_type:complete
MSMVSKAVVLADRQRLREALPSGEGLLGIVTTDRAEGVLYVLSRYEDMVWWLPKTGCPTSLVDCKRKLDFARIRCKQLRSESKAVMARLIWANTKLAVSTVSGQFMKLVVWLNWLHDQGIRSLAQVTPMVADRYVQHVNQLTSPNRIGGPLAPGTKAQRLLVVETCWRHLLDTPNGFDHPWPENSASALAKLKQATKPKTDIIPEEVLHPLFQQSESLLSRATELLGNRDAVGDYQLRYKNLSGQIKEKSRFLKTRGWDLGFGALNNALRELRDGCFVIILATTGIRAHELGNIRRDHWYSEVRDGERFYFLGSRSDKTHEGETSWLCPEIAIHAVKTLERLSEPMQIELEQALEHAIAVGDHQEVTRLQECSECVGLTRSMKKGNPISVISWQSLDDRLKRFATSLKLDWKLASHQFRRTFANYVVHHKLGDLRYLRDHFKHWSLDMTILYLMNEAQDLELYDEIYAAFDEKRQAIVGHWLEPDTPLSGGMGEHVRQMRSRTEKTRTYKDRREMVQAISELVYLRSTGIAWCTNDTGVDCAGGQCENCEHGCIDDNHKPFWEGLYQQQIELRQIEDLDASGSKTVERTMDRCEKVLADLGVDINRLKEQLADVETI